MIHMNQPAPDFSGVMAYQNGEFKKISLSDYKGKWLVFFFYPRDFTFVCPTEIRGFSALADEFKAVGAEILACSTDSEWSHKAWYERDLKEVTFPILADTNLSVTRSYDSLHEATGNAERATFIIDPEGNIQYIVVSTGSVGRSVPETLRALKAIQTGDLCPANWKAGEKTLGKA
jgi:alkyl hydroperoxide reductase subunit AhpC